MKPNHLRATQRIALKQALEPKDMGVVAMVLSDQNADTLPSGRGQDVISLRNGYGNWLIDNHVLVKRYGEESSAVMVCIRRTNDNGVDIIVRARLAVGSKCEHSVVRLSELL